MNEFSLISTYFAPLTENNKEALGLSDDAALITPVLGQQLVVTTDAITEKVHFFPGDDPFNLARKLLRVNLSDLAAMGATPLYYLVSCLFSTATTEEWIKRFTAGFKSDNMEFGVAVIGGDTVRQEGPLSFSLTAIGQVAVGAALTRSGAKPGDLLYVSGTIGDAALALKMLQGTIAEQEASLLSRYYLPIPRVALGQKLVGVATSAMDISDGLLQDAGHIAACSRVRLVINQRDIPLSDAAEALLMHNPELYTTVMAGGDDYELLFTISPCDAPQLIQVANEASVQVTCIGHVTVGEGVIVLGEEGKELLVEKKGYQHF